MTKKTPIILNRLSDALEAQGVKLKRQQLLRVAAAAFGYRDDNVFSAADREGALDAPKGIPNGVDDLGLVVIEDPVAGAPFAMDVLTRHARDGRWTVSPYGNLIDIGHIVDSPGRVASRKIYSAIVTHRHGTDVYFGLTEAILEAELAAYCRQFWNEVVEKDASLPEEPEGMGDAEIVSTYFDVMIEHEGGEFLDRNAPQEITFLEPDVQRGGHVYGRMDHEHDDAPVWWTRDGWGPLSEAIRFDVAEGDPTGSDTGFWETLPGTPRATTRDDGEARTDNPASRWKAIPHGIVLQGSTILAEEPIEPASGVILVSAEMQSRDGDEGKLRRVVLSGRYASIDDATAWRDALAHEIHLPGMEISFLAGDRVVVALPDDGDVETANTPADWVNAVRDLLTPAKDRERIMADFRPEAWVRDNAIEVDVDEDKEIDVTYEILLMGLDDASELQSQDSDHLLDAVRAPRWIRDWNGPFTIDTESAVAEARHLFGK